MEETLAEWKEERRTEDERARNLIERLVHVIAALQQWNESNHSVIDALFTKPKPRMPERDRALPIPPAPNNSLVNTAVNHHRSHPGEMVLLEVVAARALLIGHYRRKERQEKYREQAAEELKQRGWDGGIKAHEEAQHRFGMLSLPTQQDSYPPRSAAGLARDGRAAEG